PPRRRLSAPARSLRSLARQVVFRPARCPSWSCRERCHARKFAPSRCRWRPPFLSKVKMTSRPRRRRPLDRLPRKAHLSAMFIQTESTPNPRTLKFLPGRDVLGQGSREYADADAGLASPLATALFDVDGVERVYLGGDFITIT